MVNIGVVGLGGRSVSVLLHLLPQSQKLRLKGGFDTEAKSIDVARARLGLPDLVSYSNLAALVGDPEIDWVFIGSWNCDHAAAAIAALDAGKSVFCEKPLATTLNDCMAVREAVLRARGVFAFGLVLRYSPHYQRMRQVISDGRLGDLISFEFNETLRPGHGGYIFGNWRRHTANAGSNILEKCCHDLDIANWLVGSIPVRVASFGGKRIFTPENDKLRDAFGRDAKDQSIFEEWPDANRVNPFSGDSDLLDHQVVILEYANGVRASLHINCLAGMPERRFYMLGTRGTLRADAFDGTISFQKVGRETKLEDLSIGPNPDGHGGGDSVLGADLAATMLEGKKPLAGIKEALQSAVVALAIDEAQATGKVVDLHSYWAKMGQSEAANDGR